MSQSSDSLDTQLTSPQFLVDPYPLYHQLRMDPLVQRGHRIACENMELRGRTIGKGDFVKTYLVQKTGILIASPTPISLTSHIRTTST